ncbi:MAG: nitronate monooxygenase [Actinomycetes bacterium]
MAIAARAWPTIIQGGMGVGLSNWRLAKEVSLTGQLGVVSGTAVDTVIARRLQNGDEGGHIRRALSHFPSQEVAGRMLARYFRPDGRKPDETYVLVPKPSVTPSREALEIVILSNFVEVWLAKEGHDGVVGINYLEKIQMATAPAVLGAILAKVDYILMGAGIPRELPRLIRDFAAGAVGSIHVEVIGAAEPHLLSVDPKEILGADLPLLQAPKFIAIVSTDILASYLAKDEATKPDGFVVEGHRAGGHNAPPRGKIHLNELNEPIYGDRDEPNLTKMSALGIPFWLAGAYGNPEMVAAAQDLGAEGVQVGTLFALSSDSGLRSDLRSQLLTEIGLDTLKIYTDPAASPTNFPIKVAQLEGTISDGEISENRNPLCDMGYLRVPFLNPNGRIDYRCAAEPVDMFIKKGGDVEELHGRECLCNGLTANIGLGQHRRNGYDEPPIVTLGSDLESVQSLLKIYPEGFTAREATIWLLQSSKSLNL